MEPAREQQLLGHDVEVSKEQEEDAPEGHQEEVAPEGQLEEQANEVKNSVEPEESKEKGDSREELEESGVQEKLEEPQEPGDLEENPILPTESPKTEESIEKDLEKEKPDEDPEELPTNVSQEKQAEDLKPEEDTTKPEVVDNPEELASQEDSGEEKPEESKEEKDKGPTELSEESPEDSSSKETEEIEELTESLKIEESQGENQEKIATAEATEDLSEIPKEESTEILEESPKNIENNKNREDIETELSEESSKTIEEEKNLKNSSLEVTEELKKDLKLEENLENTSSEIQRELPEESLEEPEEKNLEKELEENQETTKAEQLKSPPPEEDLPNEQVTLFLRQLVHQLWPELGSSPELRLERASAKGDNYLGVVWRLQVAAGRRSLVVKLPPQNRVRRKQFFARPCFLRETAAYEEFLPLAERFQEEWSVPLEDRFRQHAHCFGTRSDEPNECIVLEDLSATGYLLHNRFQDLSVEQVRLVIRSYAKLHAVSLAAKKQWPDRVKPLQVLVDIFEQRRDDYALGVYFENLKGSALSSLLSPKDDGVYRSRLEAYFSRGSYFDLLLPLVSGSNCEPFAVICHGDCWNNNILYRVGASGQVEDVRLIDWQLMRYASPVTDLAYFLFTCTSRSFRQEHLLGILEDYYLELGLHLERLGEKVDELMPRRAFEEQVKNKAAVGLLLAMMVLPIVTMQGQDVPDLQAISERIEAGATTDLHGAGFLGAGNETTFRQRMREVILDCVDFDYI
ncbi:uncharacterized protein Dana_GF22424 [Drosophila ananassae]|uniref:CHK kinase-like domain-containing protein n=1 Tax=Drosophila ananassae TaxID=7217 RepID=B3MWM8_DROAN|nr:uncharacterized protein LOC6505085 [Drosophila ananassae]EDV35013.1 uncharacterized protein Dana_GF22424 [Drosophila ananassae]